jgi:TolB-like protein/cytochrome c-type biogenesis protein CcmH/NrfG
LSKSEIHERLWPQTFVSEATLASVVSELRAALGDDPKTPRFVRTVHGHGYAFSGSAAEEEAPARGPAPLLRRYQGRGPALASAALVVVAVAGAALMRTRRGPGETAGGPRSLAVLPLKNLSNDAGQEYLADGLTEALITSLGNVGGLRVVGRTSVMRYKDAARPIPEIARELGADLLVEGSALRTGGRVRLSARLVEASGDRQVWERTYDRDVDDTARLPDAVARDVAAAARVALTQAQRERLLAARPVDPQAYDAYLRGRYQLARGSLDSNRQAIELFQEALGRDPQYAPSYAHLSSAYNTLASVWAGQPPREMRALAVAAAEKALAIDPDLSDAHTFLGNAQLYDWEFTSAERHFRRALELDPASAAAHGAYATYLIAQDRGEEAVAEARTAQELDVLSVRTRRQVGYALYQSRRYDEAIAHLQGVVATEPKDTFSRWFLGDSYAWKSRHAEAVAELEQAVALSDRAPALLGMLSEKLVRAGRTGEARSLLAELDQASRTRYVSPAAFIHVHVALGEREQAFRWLEQGFEERINYMIFLNTLEALDPLRSDPRFRHLVQRIGLPGP